MVGYSQSGANVANQFGMPLYGVSGAPLPFGGNYFWVDGTNGSDGNTGGPTDPFKTLTQALSACLAGNNDVVFFKGTFSPTATFTWNKNNTHLIGLAGPSNGNGASLISVANTAATSGAFSPLVNVTATGCIFQNVSALSGIAQAATQVCWAEAGGSNTYISCNFNQVGNATAGAQAGNRALTIASANNYFFNCVIGSDAIVRATAASATMEFLAGSASCCFESCSFVAWTSVGTATHVNAAASTMAGTTVFDNCAFCNNIQGAGFTAMAVAFNVNTGAGGICLLGTLTASVGATVIATSGPVYVSGPVPTATTSNLAIAAT